MNKKSFFWASYADLMSSLFFIMLILFILTVIMLRKKNETTENELNKIREIQNAISNIDAKYFEYNQEHKKHILKIDVEFPTGSANILAIDTNIREQLLDAGKTIVTFIQNACNREPNSQYLLIIEGQASKDNFPKNDELSYERALALVNYWNQNEVIFNSEQCEVIVSGSGQHGTLRIQPDTRNNKKNQRFLIHILPKPGVIK